jgi:hypothetical protein
MQLVEQLHATQLLHATLGCNGVESPQAFQMESTQGGYQATVAALRSNKLQR